MGSVQFLRMVSTPNIVLIILLNSLYVLAISKEAFYQPSSLAPLNLLEIDEDEFSAAAEYGSVTIPKLTKHPKLTKEIATNTTSMAAAAKCAGKTEKTLNQPTTCDEASKWMACVQKHYPQQVEPMRAGCSKKAKQLRCPGQVCYPQSGSVKGGKTKGGRTKGGRVKGEESVDPGSRYHNNSYNPYNPYNRRHQKPNSTTHHNKASTHHKSPVSGICPAHCSGNGYCDGSGGNCYCKEGFTGTECAKPKCPNDCNNNGHCVQGECRCFAGWSGFDCSYRGCRDQCNHQGYCHIGEDRSACLCFPGFSGVTCAIGPACGWGESGLSCSGNGECVGQKCFCEDSYTGSRCEQHVCPSGGETKTMCSGFGVCNVGTGTCECEYPHFGVACENAKCPGDCSENGSCDRYGHCKCNAGFFGKDCSPKNCPDDCNGHGSCVFSLRNGGSGAAVAAQCVCHPGWGPDATDQKPNSCSARICDAGYVGKNCEQRVCLDNCNSKEGHGQCDRNTFTCSCKEGWSGVSCQFKTCPDLCNHHGTCNDGVCNCKDDWSGKKCEIAPKKCPNSCSSHGSCFHGKCYCDDGWTGKDCHKPSNSNRGKTIVTPYQGIVCIPRCSANGQCMTINGTNQCFCKDGWSGLACGTYVHTPGNYRSLDGGKSIGPALIDEASEIRPRKVDEESGLSGSAKAISQRLTRKTKKQSIQNAL